MKAKLPTLLVLLLALAFSPGCSNFVKKVEGTDNINLVDNIPVNDEILDHQYETDKL